MCGMLVVAVAQSGCGDISERCPEWVATGRCTSSPYLMHAQCRRSCDLCDGVPKPQAAALKPQAAALKQRVAPTPYFSMPVAAAAVAGRPADEWAGVRPEAIVRLFECSQLAFLLSVGLLLSSAFASRGRRGLAPLAGISWVALELNLLAAISRVPFQYVTHFFEHWLTAFEIVASISTLGALVAVLNFGLRAEVGSRPKEQFATGAALAVSLASACALGCANADGFDGFVPYVSLAFSVFLETAAMLAQRAHFERVKRMPSSASNALLLLAASRALRLAMWALMCWAGEFELTLMLADAVHVALVYNFVAAYVRSRAAGTSELLIATLSR